jgi:hypothetical protein
MVSSRNHTITYTTFECNLGKTCRSEFFKDGQNCTSPMDESNLKSLKNSRVMFFHISRETILLLVNDIHEKIIQSHAK